MSESIRTLIMRPILREMISISGETLTEICHALSTECGWWTHIETGLDLKRVMNSPDGPIERLLSQLLVTQKLCLSHSEISEAMEGHRKGLMDDKLPHRSMLEVELADLIIRVFDLGGALNLSLGDAIAEKLAFNANRPDHQLENRAAPGGKSY